MINNMKILFGILILVAGFAWYVIRTQSPDLPAAQSALLSEWQAQPSLVKDINRVELNRGQDHLVMAKSGQHWILNGGFYVNMEPLVELFQSLQTATIVEAKTSNPDNHARLDLADDDLSVSLFQGDQLMKSIHLGKTGAAGQQFVRLAGADQTYLVEGLSPVTVNEDTWVLKTVLNITANDISSVTVSPRDEASFTVHKDPESGQWQLDSMPEDHRPKDGADLGVLSQGLTRLMIDSAERKEVSEWSPVVVLTYQLNNGAQLQLSVYQQDDSHYLRITGAEWPHYEPWLMSIAAYKFNALNQSLDQFIEPVGVAETAGEIE